MVQDIKVEAIRMHPAAKAQVATGSGPVYRLAAKVVGITAAYAWLAENVPGTVVAEVSQEGRVPLRPRAVTQRAVGTWPFPGPDNMAQPQNGAATGPTQSQVPNPP